MMDKYWGKAKDGRYICPVCNEKFDEDLLPTGECPNCGFHEQGGLKPKIKGAKYDEGKPRPSLVPVEAIEAIMQVREYCDNFTQNCQNHCLKHLDVRDCKEVQQCGDASGRGNG